MYEYRVAGATCTATRPCSAAGTAHAVLHGRSSRATSLSQKIHITPSLIVKWSAVRGACKVVFSELLKEHKP